MQRNLFRGTPLNVKQNLPATERVLRNFLIMLDCKMDGVLSGVALRKKF